MDNTGNDREDIVEGVLAVNKKRDMLEWHDEESGVPKEYILVMEEVNEEYKPKQRSDMEEDTSEEDVEE